jgi:hypothetical protein
MGPRPPRWCQRWTRPPQEELLLLRQQELLVQKFQPLHLVRRAAVNNNTIEEPMREPEVILGHRPIRALGDLSLSDSMGTSHFVLNQVQNVLQWERGDLDEERLRLLEYFSLLKAVTAFEKMKAEVTQKFADVMEILLDRQHTMRLLHRCLWLRASTTTFALPG